MKGIRKKYSSYGNFYSSEAEVFYPGSVHELQQIIQFARKEKRKMTPAGSFNSFDNQNSGSDMVISFVKMNFIRFNNEDATLEVGPGARWGSILKEAYRHFCIPFTTITGSQPTAGGTLSAHTNSVYTPGCGKEGKHCLEMDVVTASGELITCSRTQHADLFYGVISGLGFLGFIVRIQYQLFRIGYPFQIQVECRHYDTVENLEERFDVRESAKFKTPEDLGSQGSMFYLDKGAARFNVYTRNYVRAAKPQHHFSWYTYIGVLTMLIVRLFPQYANQAMIQDEKRPMHKKRLLKGAGKIYYGLLWADTDYYYNRIFSRLGRLIGYKPKLYQNSYFIPLEENKVTEFTQLVCALLNKYQLQFGMFDIMYIPRDERFILSSSRDSSGFYINTTFFESAKEKDVMLFYEELNIRCLEMNGKMNLVKNLFIEPALLEQMYKKELQELAALKNKFDPERRIQSHFFSQKFPSYFS